MFSPPWPTEEMQSSVALTLSPEKILQDLLGCSFVFVFFSSELDFYFIFSVYVVKLVRWLVDS